MVSPVFEPVASNLYVLILHIEPMVENERREAEIDAHVASFKAGRLSISVYNAILSPLCTKIS